MLSEGELNLVGTWVAPDGRRLVFEDLDGVLVVSAHLANGRHARRTGFLLPRRLRRVRAAYSGQAFAGDRREVHFEAGLPGLGPQVCLTLEDDLLVPSVEGGVYDDEKEDFGLTWLFPLAPFRKAGAGSS